MQRDRKVREGTERKGRGGAGGGGGGRVLADAKSLQKEDLTS